MTAGRTPSACQAFHGEGKNNQIRFSKQSGNIASVSHNNSGQHWHKKLTLASAILTHQTTLGGVVKIRHLAALAGTAKRPWAVLPDATR